MIILQFKNFLRQLDEATAHTIQRLLSRFTYLDPTLKKQMGMDIDNAENFFGSRIESKAIVFHKFPYIVHENYGIVPLQNPDEKGISISSFRYFVPGSFGDSVVAILRPAKYVKNKWEGTPNRWDITTIMFRCLPDIAENTKDYYYQQNPNYYQINNIYQKINALAQPFTPEAFDVDIVVNYNKFAKRKGKVVNSII